MKEPSSKKESVLVVDDVQLNLEVIVEYLINAGFDVYVATHGEEALKQLKRVKPDLILLDVMLPGANGFEICRQIKEMEAVADIPIIFMTALSDLEDKVKGFEAGGVDYVTKPIQHQEILARVNTHLSLRRTQKELHDANENLEKRVVERTTELHCALQNIQQLKNQLQAENAYLQEEIKADHNFDEIIGNSESLQRVLQEIQEVAPMDTTVLILGESGTGKELFARALHSASNRSKKPFIKVNCAAIPANLVESEFFGHEKGAFTGATVKREGRFSLANAGTIFLDEIGELPLGVQAKLLRVLQEGEIDAVGSSQTKKVDVRVIAATNQNLKNFVKEGKFREDLYYRLNVFPIEIPALRERGEDILLLASYFANQFAKKMGKKVTTLCDDSRYLLLSYNWPGNIRELQNILERAVITARNGRLNLDRAFPESVRAESQKGQREVEEKAPRILTVQDLQELEHQNIVLALTTTKWRVSGENGAAALLGMKPTTLNSRIKALGIKKNLT